MLTVLSPGAALVLFWFGLHGTDLSAKHTGSATADRKVALIAAIGMLPTVAIVACGCRWRRSSTAGRIALVTASSLGMAIACVLGFLEIVVVWLSAMGT